MRKFLIVFSCCIFLPLGCYCHTSTLTQVLDTNGEDITPEFGCLSADSNAGDEANVCYGTNGEKAQASKEGSFFLNLREMPRCHSEFYLLRKIKAKNIPIRDCTIHIDNSQ